MNNEQPRSVTWSWMAMSMMGFAQVVAIGIGTWLLVQTLANTSDIVKIQSELAVRVSFSEKESTSFVRKEEIVELRLAIGELKGALRELNSEIKKQAEEARTK